MATPTLATVGGAEFSVGYPGQIANITSAQGEIETRINENATAVDFGAAVCRGAATTPGTIGNCRPAFNPGIVLGFAVRALSEANTTVTAGTVNYPQYGDVPIMKSGYMWVTAAENATEGDTCVIVVATPATVGSSTGGAANATTRLATSAVWQQTVVSGAVGLIHIENNA